MNNECCKFTWLRTKLRTKYFSGICLVKHDILINLYMPDRCPITGILLDYSVNTHKGFDKASIDRIVPGVSGGKYEMGNIMVMSSIANNIKNDFMFADLDHLKDYVMFILTRNKSSKLYLDIMKARE